MRSVAKRLALRSQWLTVGCKAVGSDTNVEQSPPKVHITASILNITIFIGKYVYERAFQVLGIDLHHHDHSDRGLSVGSGSDLVQHLELWILLAILVLLALDGVMWRFFPIM